MTPPAELDTHAQTLVAADNLMADQRWDEAIELLTRTNRLVADPAIEVRIVTARHRAYVAPSGPAPLEPWPTPVPDAFAGTSGIPEVSGSELSADLLAAGLQHHGALLVRGLLPAADIEPLLTDVRRAFDAAEAAASGAPVSETSPDYRRFEAGAEYDFGQLERDFSLTVGAVLAVEAPRALFRIIEALHSAQLGTIIGEYLGEFPALSAKKTSLRRAGPDSPTEWHQDGSFLGRQTRTVNVWTALTPCGVDAPSIDVFTKPFDELVETGTDDALFSWSVSREHAERLGADDAVRPRFAPGDALFFDQMNLHRTGISPTMTQERYAIESWFFAPSSFPYEQVPISF